MTDFAEKPTINWLFADIDEIIDCWSDKEGNDTE